MTESGVSVRETARRVKVMPPAVSHWRKRFREHRLAGLHDQLKSGRPRTRSDNDIAALLNTALSRQPKAATHWSVRDRTGRTGLARLGVPRDIAERVLNHARERIEGTYDVHAYLDEKRTALEKWAAHLKELTK